MLIPLLTSAAIILFLFAAFITLHILPAVSHRAKLRQMAKDQAERREKGYPVDCK